MSNPLELLRIEVAELREVVDSQGLELQRLRRAFAELKVSVSSDGDRRSEDSFTVVSNQPSGESNFSASAGVQRPASSGYPSSGARGTTTGVSLSWSEREAICEEIGLFIARCLAGEHRGSSGRDRNPLQSKYWLVARGFGGEVFHPVRVFRAWGSCKPLVKSKSDCGDSVFIGVPTGREARAVCAAAGLEFPSVIER